VAAGVRSRNCGCAVPEGDLERRPLNKDFGSERSRRGNLVGAVFLKSVDARREFSRTLSRCALKEWPDRAEKIRHNQEFAELQFQQLEARARFVSQHCDQETDSWADSTSTANAQGRIQEGWCDSEEQQLRSLDAAYIQICGRLDELLATADSEALDGPFTMAKRDPELISAAWKLDGIVRALDSELRPKQS
jgi:hypothetical protein